MRDKEFDTFRDKVRADLPNLSAEVFGLRNTGYKGCGFHWGMEKDLGYVIRAASNLDKYPDEFEKILLKVVYESLKSDIERIKKEINDNKKH